ncbi:fructosamine kinase family protein [Streptomyces parvulus]|nr:fructosamine kinase family protein [Streptomyces parvulus]
MAGHRPRGAGRAGAGAADRFGRDLAALHATGAPAFGAAPPGGPEDAYIGLAPMRNAAGDDWPRWYASTGSCRICAERSTPAPSGRPRRPTSNGSASGCPAWRGRRSRARLHGDLWSGNVLWGADGQVHLIDPAAHGGHRETDLAMLRLFGCPHLDRILAAYDEAAPLAEGWADRVGVHQLFPLLVHAVLFGRGYAEQALAAARSALRRAP